MVWRHFLIAIRWQNVLIIWMMQTIIFSQYVLPYCGRDHYAFVSLVLLIVATGSVLGAGNVYNDLQDMPTDSIHPGKPALVGSKVSVTQARKWVYSLNVLAIAVGIIGVWLCSWPYILLIIIVMAIVGLVLYSRKLKSTLLVGNFVVALLCALAVWMTTVLLPYCNLGIYVDWDSRTPVILYGYVVNAFMITLLREVVKDKEDAEYDMKAGIFTVGSLPQNRFRLVVNGLVFTNFVVNGIWFYQLRNVLSDQSYYLGMLIIFIPLVLIAWIYNLSHRSNVNAFLSQLIKIYIVFALLLLILWQKT